MTGDISARALHYVSKIKNDLLEDYMAIQDKKRKSIISIIKGCKDSDSNIGTQNNT